MTLLVVPPNPLLVGVALVICATSTFGVFRVRARMGESRGLVRGAWLFLCGLEAAAGMWGSLLHWGLAFNTRESTGYDPLQVLGSLLLAVAGATLAFGLAWSGKDRTRQALGGAVLTLTIGAVLFTASGALRGPETIIWEPIQVWLAIVTSGAAAIAAIMIAGSAQKLSRQFAGGGLLFAAVMVLYVVAISGSYTVLNPAVETPVGTLHRTGALFTASLVSVMMILVGYGAAYIDDSSHRNALARMRRLADATREGIALLTESGRITDCNAAFAALCGTSASELFGRELEQVLALDNGRRLRLDAATDAHLICADGEPVPVAARLSAAAEQHEADRTGLILAVSDLREQRAAEAHIRFLNEHDVLTGLPNRTVLMRELGAAVARVTGDRHENLALLCIRVVNSPEINTVHGHVAGDALLAKVGERLKRLAGETAGAARIGGDEFALYVFGERCEEQMQIAEAFFAQVVQVLGRPFVWNAHAIEPQVRIGVASTPQDALTADELVMHAESALQASDEDSVAGVSLFRRDLHDAMAAQRALAQDLRAAIAADQLTVFYQPQARAEDGVLCGFEALVRWTHPTLGFLPPDRFIGVAEESGLIGALGEWVLRRACLDAMTWPRPVPVAVNLSPLQVGEVGLPARVHEILLETGLPPHRLELEITESALFRDYQRALDTLRRLKALGVKIAMDDFGTGFSSLSTLQSFPFDKIKIDKSFVEGVGKLERSTVIVKAVLGIGRGLAIPVVAEGVETEEQMAFLRDELCAAVQGYHIGKPGPVELHAALLESAPKPAKRTRRIAAA